MLEEISGSQNLKDELDRMAMLQGAGKWMMIFLSTAQQPRGDFLLTCELCILQTTLASHGYFFKYEIFLNP